MSKGYILMTSIVWLALGLVSSVSGGDKWGPLIIANIWLAAFAVRSDD